MNGRVRLVSLFGMALVVASFVRTRSKGEFALGLVSLMLVGVVYFDQTRRLDGGDAAPVVEPVASPDPAAQPKPTEVRPSTMPDLLLLNVPSDGLEYGPELPQTTEAEPVAEHPKEMLEKRQLMMQDYMMQPSVTRKPTASVLNSYIESLARQHRAENSRDPSLRRQ